MPRPTKAIDIIGMQKIADDIKPDQFNNAMGLCNYIAQRYNNEIFPHNSNAHVDHQLVKLRITAGVIKLSFDMPKGKRGRQPGVKITPEQKEKMQIGRTTKKKPVESNASGMDKWRENMQNDFSSKKLLMAGVLAGKKNACVKAMCINCMGGYKNRSKDTSNPDPPLADAIRDCRGYNCPLYPIRPFQAKTNNAGENQ
jgi:hypothetical protein